MAGRKLGKRIAERQAMILELGIVFIPIFPPTIVKKRFDIFYQQVSEALIEFEEEQAVLLQ